MADQTRLSRRTVIGTAAATAAAGVLAGCITADDPEDGDDEGETGPYSVTMEPVGTVEFDSIPERWVPYTGDYADMGVALGRADGLAGIGIASRYGAAYYDEIPGLSVDTSELTELWSGSSTDRETFLALDADVHLIDPNFMINRLGWERDDVDYVESSVAPFVGNSIFSGSYPWHDYTYYSLYEAFEKIAEVFQERDRYEAFADLHEEVVSDVQSRVPEDRPDVAVVWPNSESVDSFLPYVIGDGTQSKQWRELGVGRALAESDVADFHDGRGAIDFETLAQVDPDVIAIRTFQHYTPDRFEDEIVSTMRDHPVGGDLRAVQNDRVVQGGMSYQGPIIYLFQLEQAARGVFPDEFGGEELFDRDRVGDIVAGDFEA